MAGTTLDPATASANYALSNGNLTATSSSVATGGAKAASPQSSGKFYIEVAFGAQTGNNDYVGICETGAAYSGLVSNPAHSIGCVRLSGTIYLGGSSQSRTIGTLTSSLVCLAIDLDNRRFWARRTATGAWNATSGTAYNPTTPSTGVDFSALASPFVVVCASSTNAATYTWDLGDSAFSGAVPSGFTAGWPGLVTAQASALILA